MPIYEYKCHSCGETFEVMQKFSDTPLEVHEKCGKGPVERLISRSSLKFKGTGWYVTDYGGSGNGKKQAAKEGKDSKDSKDSKESKESKKDSSSSSSSSSSESTTKSESSTSKPSTSDKKV
jgi:putative FmdB family regulatory protein